MADAKLVPMAMSKKEAKAFSGPVAPSNSPRYSWGLSISLDNSSLDKLKMKDLPKVGSYVTLTARCCVQSISESQQVDGDENRSVSLQIEDMAVQPEASAKRHTAKARAK